MDKRSVLYALVGLCLMQACALDEGGVRDLDPERVAAVTRYSNDAAVEMPALSRLDLTEGTLLRDLPPLQMPWRPRSHPPGTLLIDRYRDLWMVENWHERRIIPGNEVLEEFGLGHLNPIRMTVEEEECVLSVPDDEYWYPEIVDWHPFFGPNDEEEVYVVDWIRHQRRETSVEALVSYGFRPWRIRPFDAGEEAWNSFRDVEPPLSFRDGSIVRTELATYYVLRGRAYAFQPQALAEQAGYQPEDTLPLSEARLRRLARVTTALTRAHFDACPALDDGLTGRP